MRKVLLGIVLLAGSRASWADFDGFTTCETGYQSTINAIDAEIAACGVASVCITRYRDNVCINEPEPARTACIKKMNTLIAGYTEAVRQLGLCKDDLTYAHEKWGLLCARLNQREVGGAGDDENWIVAGLHVIGDIKLAAQILDALVKAEGHHESAGKVEVAVVGALKGHTCRKSAQATVAAHGVAALARLEYSFCAGRQAAQGIGIEMAHLELQAAPGFREGPAGMAQAGGSHVFFKGHPAFGGRSIDLDMTKATRTDGGGRVVRMVSAGFAISKEIVLEEDVIGVDGDVLIRAGTPGSVKSNAQDTSPIFKYQPNLAESHGNPLSIHSQHDLGGRFPIVRILQRDAP